MSEPNLLFPLVLEYCPWVKGPKKWRVTQEIRYEMYFKGSGIWVVIPVGYMTDLATVPFPVSMLFPKSGKWNHAAVVHDYLCDHGRETYSQEDIDKAFLKIMELTGVNKIKRTLAYRSVKRFQQLEAIKDGRIYSLPNPKMEEK